MDKVQRRRLCAITHLSLWPESSACKAWSVQCFRAPAWVTFERKSAPVAAQGCGKKSHVSGAASAPVFVSPKRSMRACLFRTEPRLNPHSAKLTPSIVETPVLFVTPRESLGSRLVLDCVSPSVVCGYLYLCLHAGLPRSPVAVFLFTRSFFSSFFLPSGT